MVKVTGVLDERRDGETKTEETSRRGKSVKKSLQ